MEYVFNIIGIPQEDFKKAFAPLVAFAQHLHDHLIPHARNNYKPHILSDRALALFSGLLVAVKIFTLAAVSLGPVTPAFSSAITIDNIISLTNESRQQFDLKSLTESSVLDQAAQSKANDMLAKGYFAHNTPDGHTPWDFIASAGYSYLMAGENLAVNFTEAENVETAWMNSPGHKANILNRNFEEIGIGISQGSYQGHNAIFVVQMFGTPLEQKVAITKTPTKVATTPVPVPTPAPVALPLNTQATAEQSANQKIHGVQTQAPATTNEVSGAEAGPQTSAPVQSASDPVAIVHGAANLGNGKILINAQVNGPVVKVTAYFGEQAIMLSPKDNSLWTGEVPVSQLAQSNTTVKLKAEGTNGQSDQLQLADFSASTTQNYNLAGTAPTSKVNFFGKFFNAKSAESQFYLLFIAGLLTSLIIAIAVKRHVQHLTLIANSSFVIIFATMLWWAG